jgi:zinc transporter ZupT
MHLVAHLLIIAFIFVTANGSYQSSTLMSSSNKKKERRGSPLRIDIHESVITESGNRYSLPTPTLLKMRGGLSIPSLSSMPLYSVKIFSQFLLTLINVLCFTLPLYNEKISGNTYILSLANSFAAGIFLMLAFGHMLPHSLTILESIGKDKNLAFYMTLIGYLIVFFIENVAFDVHHVEGGDNDTSSSKSAIVLLFAMAVHSLMETAALGLTTDSRSTILLATSIGLHQPAESLALLVAFLKTGMSKTVIMKWLGLFRYSICIFNTYTCVFILTPYVVLLDLLVSLLVF